MSSPFLDWMASAALYPRFLLLSKTMTPFRSFPAHYRGFRLSHRETAGPAPTFRMKPGVRQTRAGSTINLPPGQRRRNQPQGGEA